MDRMKDERFMFLLQHYDHTDQWMDEVMDALKADRAHIAELEAQIKELLDKPCSMCGQDERIAQIGRRIGFRPDVGALEIHRLQAKLDAVKLCQRYEVHFIPIKKAAGLYMLVSDVLKAIEEQEQGK